ncbi:MAG: hypothetical protein EYC69_08655 [Bacteroidetes bacterium]|nr:MAG: hypothetical protein EYC69_08655 [Bacteroidota bacterium]
MRKIFIVLVICFFATSAYSQLYISGIGIRAGKFNTGLTSKFFFVANNNSGMQFDAYYTNIASGGYTLKGFFVKQVPFKIPIIQLPLDFVFGGGVHAGYFPFETQGYYRKSKKDANYYDKSVVSVGLDATIQIEYQVKKIAPFTIGIDCVPFFEFMNPGPEFIDFGVSVRYVFR